MKKRFSGPQIVAKLRQADKLLGQGKTVEEVCKEIDVTDATYYRWRQKYGGMSPDITGCKYSFYISSLKTDI
jgi:predicted secreted protein